MAATSGVSTRISRSLFSPTSAVASGAVSVFAVGVGAARGAAAAGCAVSAAPAVVGGLGCGLTNSACHTYSVRNARKIANKTRRSIYVIIRLLALRGLDLKVRTTTMNPAELTVRATNDAL